MPVNSVQCNGQIWSSLSIKRIAFLASTLAPVEASPISHAQGHVAQRTCTYCKQQTVATVVFADAAGAHHLAKSCLFQQARLVRAWRVAISLVVG